MTRQRASGKRGFVGYGLTLLTAITVVATSGVGTGAAIVGPSVAKPAAAGISTAGGALDLSGAYQAIDGAQDLRAIFTASTLRLTPQAAGGASWTLESDLRGFGAADDLQPLGFGVPRVTTDRVAYDFPSLTMWVSSTGQGLEQGFTIAEPLAGERSKDPQVIRMALQPSPGLASEVSKDGRQVVFSTADQRALAYSIVRATDAAGATVPAHFEPSGIDGALMGLDLVVEGAEAAFPVEIALRFAARAANDPHPEAAPGVPQLTLDEGGVDASAGETVSSMLVPPPNDTCGGAEVIPPAGPFPYLTAVTADITDATTGGDPAPMTGCPVGTPTPSRGIWYRFTPAASSTFTISTCADAPTASTVDDTLLTVYTSSTSACGGVMTPIVCDDDACAVEGFQSVVTAALTGGVNYFIVVHKWDNVAPTAGNTAIQLRVSSASPPSNDSCAGPIPLSLNIPVKGTTLAAVNDYTLSGVAPGCYGLPTPPAPIANVFSTAPGRDVVYAFTATSTGNYSFRVKDYTGGGNPVLYVVSSCPAPSAIATPPCVGAANRRSTTTPFAEEVMCLPVTGGTTVYAFVDENLLTGGGNFTIEVNPCPRESEPGVANNTPATANGAICGIEGSSTPSGGDADFFGLGAVAPGSRIFSMLDNVANNTGDHQMRVTTGADTYEFDDDDGDAVFGAAGFAPVIAGTNLVPGGAAFIRVNPFSTSLLSEPYRMYQVVQPPAAAAVPETEPNGPANPPNSAGPNYFSGVTSTTDQDNFGFYAAAGDLIFVAVDTDPDMNAVATDVTIGLFGPSGLVVQVNGSTAVSSVRAPVPGSLIATTPVAPAEGLVYRAPVSGPYIAAILGVAAGPGNYLMSISKNCLTGGGGLAPIPYTFPDTGKVVIELFPPFFPGSGPEVIRLRQNGPDARVDAQPQVGNTIQIELVSMNLSGVSRSVGTVNVFESSLRVSPGVTLVNSPTSLDSFFDVFIDVELPTAGVRLFNDLAISVRGHHDSLPPHDTAFETDAVPNPDIFLYDVTDPPPVGVPRGRVRYVRHDADPEFPPPDTDCFDTTLTTFFETLPPLPPYSATLLSTGRTDIRRGAPSPFPPGPQTVPIEMVELSLRGNDPFLQNYQILLNNNPPWPLSQGSIKGQLAQAFPADSFIEVQPMILSPNPSVGQLVTQPAPPGVRVEATVALGNPLGTVPPGTGQTYKQTNPATLLYQPSNPIQPVGRLTQTIHRIDKPVSWEVPPPADKDCFDSRVRARLTLIPPFHPGCSEILELNGPFKVLRGNPIDPGNGRDLIRTIMACYRFVGTSGAGGCGLGPVTAHPSPTNPSLGQIQSLTPEENFPADSFFDIFTDLETGAGTLHTNSPTRMSTTINSVPPPSGEIYLGPGTSIPIFDSANNHVGDIVIISHEIFSSIVCPCECEPYIKIRPDKTTLEVGIPKGGAGVDYDVVKGTINGVSPNWLSSFSAASCLVADGGPIAPDPVNPTVSQLFWYASKDAAFFKYYGTYNSCPIASQVGDRDVAIAPVCP